MSSNGAQGKKAEKSKTVDKKNSQGVQGNQGKNGAKRAPTAVSPAKDKNKKEIAKNPAKKEPTVLGKSDVRGNLEVQPEQKAGDIKNNKDKRLSSILKPLGGKRKEEQKSASKNVKGSKELVVDKKEIKQGKETNGQKKLDGSKEKDVNDKKMKGSKEGTTDPNDPKKVKTSKEAIKDANDMKPKASKEGMKNEMETKDGKPKEGKGNEDAKKVPVPPKKPHLLKVGEVLLDKFKVEGLLADGGFAQVFAAIHEDTQTRWAVKIESEKCDRKRMKLEIMVLMLLRGKANIPEIVAMGTCPTGHFIILELVGRNLSDLRRQLPRRRISSSSLYRSMLQVRR
ncbi:hypothetical protein Y032_0024g1034 [Ancylostoma ceylanicum]|uniref:Protein kinase domain-containing protein n=1 Tax=Ancylostoma ceylanicum TaxID=53326 RepID=A0A016UVV2_9BILA|nr:hypothetical protein Y032_0024g1034 [Ancylostoma ceylanicum]